MAMPKTVRESPLMIPPYHGLSAIAAHDGPPATYSWRHIGGQAVAQTVVYLDTSHFVWWSAEVIGYGRGAYGSGGYGVDLT